MPYIVHISAEHVVIDIYVFKRGFTSLALFLEDTLTLRPKKPFRSKKQMRLCVDGEGVH